MLLLKEVFTTKKDDIIRLSNGQEATIIKGDESNYKNIYIVRLEDKEIRVIDKETLTLTSAITNITIFHHRK